MAVQTFRHAAKLSPAGHRLLDRLLAVLALLYSAALDERILAWQKSGKSITVYDQFGSLTAIRKQDPEWRGMSVLVARSALIRLDRAMQAFFSLVKSGKEPGFPRFRARSRYRSFSVDDPKSARSAVRNRDGGRRGELRMKGPAADAVYDPAVAASAGSASRFPRRAQGATGRGSAPVRTGSADGPEGRAGTPCGAGRGHPEPCHPFGRRTSGAPAEACGSKRDPPRKQCAESRSRRGSKSRGLRMFAYAVGAGRTALGVPAASAAR